MVGIFLIIIVVAAFTWYGVIRQKVMDKTQRATEQQQGVGAAVTVR